MVAKLGSRSLYHIIFFFLHIDRLIGVGSDPGLWSMPWSDILLGFGHFSGEVIFPEAAYCTH